MSKTAALTPTTIAGAGESIVASFRPRQSASLENKPDRNQFRQFTRFSLYLLVRFQPDNTIDASTCVDLVRASSLMYKISTSIVAKYIKDKYTWAALSAGATSNCSISTEFHWTKLNLSAERKPHLIDAGAARLITPRQH